MDAVLEELQETVPRFDPDLDPRDRCVFRLGYWSAESEQAFWEYSSWTPWDYRRPSGAKWLHHIENGRFKRSTVLARKVCHDLAVSRSVLTALVLQSYLPPEVVALIVALACWY
jgi:hypothetical protein